MPEEFKGRGGWRGGGRPKNSKRPEGRKDIKMMGQRWNEREAEMIRAYLKKNHLTQKQYLERKVEEDMLIPEITRKLLAGGETVHAAQNIELQNYTNDLEDEDLERIWKYAGRHGLARANEKENGYTSARFIAKAELEKLAEAV